MSPRFSRGGGSAPPASTGFLAMVMGSNGGFPEWGTGAIFGSRDGLGFESLGSAGDPFTSSATGDNDGDTFVFGSASSPVTVCRPGVPAQTFQTGTHMDSTTAVRTVQWNGVHWALAGANTFNDDAVIYTTDPTSGAWSVAPIPGLKLAFGAVWSALLGLWLVAGSADGTTFNAWTAPTMAGPWTLATTPFDGQANFAYTCCVGAGGVLLVLDDTGSVVRSTDGTTWAAGVSIGTQPQGQATHFYPSDVAAVPVTDGWMTSPDGITWASVFPPMISSQSVAAVSEDPSGTVWVGIESSIAVGPWLGISCFALRAGQADVAAVPPAIYNNGVVTVIARR